MAPTKIHSIFCLTHATSLFHLSHNPILIPETPTGLQLPPFVSLGFHSYCNFLKVLTWCSLSQPRFTVILQRGRSNKKQEKVPALVSPNMLYYYFIVKKWN